MDTVDSKIRTLVTFNSTSFNTTEAKQYFINPCCFGDDVANWLISELHKRGVKTDEEPSQEDFGWYLNFEVTGTGHTFVIGRRPNSETEAGTWVGWLERSRGLMGSLMGGREWGILPSAVEEIHRILSSSPQIRDVRWHFRQDFDDGLEERGTSSPQTHS
jgi:hypothetical protein